MAQSDHHRSFFSDLKKELMPEKNQIQKMDISDKIRIRFWVGTGMAILTFVTLWEICEELWKQHKQKMRA